MSDRRAEPETDAGQLSLRLDPDRPGLPAGLRPMLPRSTPEPFDDPDFLFEPWWGGVRAFASVEVDPGTGAGSVHVIGRGTDHGPALPELTGSGGLVGRVGRHSVVLDGSLIVVDGSGRPDPRALDRRLDGRPGPFVVYLAFDVVAFDGRLLLAEPLERRRERLERTIEPGGPVLVVPAIAGEGRTLHAAATVQGIPAVIGRQRRSPYLPGTRSRLWRLIATRTATRADGAPADVTSRVIAGPGEEPEPAHEPDDPTGPIVAIFERLPLDSD